MCVLYVLGRPSTDILHSFLFLSDKTVNVYTPNLIKTIETFVDELWL